MSYIRWNNESLILFQQLWNKKDTEHVMDIACELQKNGFIKEGPLYAYHIRELSNKARYLRKKGYKFISRALRPRTDIYRGLVKEGDV